MALPMPGNNRAVFYLWLLFFQVIIYSRWLFSALALPNVLNPKELHQQSYGTNWLKEQPGYNELMQCLKGLINQQIYHTQSLNKLQHA